MEALIFMLQDALPLGIVFKTYKSIGIIVDRKITCLITAVAFTNCISTVTFAQDNRFPQGDPFASQARMHAGVYLKIPFTGGLKYNKKEKLKFGAALGFTRDYRTSNNPFAPRKQFTANLVDFKFDNKGFNALAFSGQDILTSQDGRIVLSVDEDGKMTLSKVGFYVLIIGVTVGVLVAVCGNDPDDCGTNLGKVSL